MSEFKETYEDKIKLLLRAVRSPQFRFIIIQYNHFDIKKEITHLLQEKYPQRPSLHFDIRNTNYIDFTQTIFTQGEGFVFMHDFEELLENPEFYIGFNQRRDKFSKFPIYLIGFLPSGEAYLQLCARRISDMWSLRTLVLGLEKIIELEKFDFILKTPYNLNDVNDVSLKSLKNNLLDKLLELERILTRMEELEFKVENEGLLTSLYPQVFNIYIHLEDYKEHNNKNELKVLKFWQEIIKNSNHTKRLYAISKKLGLFYLKNYQSQKGLVILQESINIGKKAGFPDIEDLEKQYQYYKSQLDPPA